MEDQEIISQVNKAIGKLYHSDSWLLINNLSEQSVSHKLAEYLQELFLDYNVDCEYNGSDFDGYNRKKIFILKENLIQNGLLKQDEELQLDEEITQRAVFPDIIIHHRGHNKENRCVIEVKKSTSKVGFEYDFIKLCHYTTNMFENTLCYQIGIFLCFTTGSENLHHTMRIFKNGVEQ